MAVSKKLWTKKSAQYRYIFAATLIILGIILNALGVGENEFAGFQRLGSWIIYVGILITIMTIFLARKRKDKIIDERQEKISYKTLQISNAILFLSLFLIMIADGILQITARYYLAASWLICYYLIIQVIIYKILEKHN